MKLEDGPNRFRMFGDILPRYVYWLNKGKSNRAFECLAFDRDLEKFTNIETDWVKTLVPTNAQGKDTQCAWAYTVQVIDRKDGKKKILGLKKKMFGAIKQLAAELGDPTDPENGYDIIVNREKTGPHAFNVEYTLNQIAMMKAAEDATSDEDKVIMAEADTIDNLMPRPTADEQKKEVEAFIQGKEVPEPKADKEAISELG